MTTDLVRLPRRQPATTAVDTRRLGRISSILPPWREGIVVFAVFAVLYLAVAWFMVRQNIVFPDALSRVANAFYVLYSRDPHLPAIGFVWNPLPSLVLLPLLPFKALFPVLVEQGFAGNIQSALSMAAAVAGVATCLRKLRVTRTPRILLTVLFGLQPMVLLYAGSGLSEPMFVWFLVLTASALISWAHDNRAGQLVAAGLALALAYLTRYEAVAPALAVAAFVGVVSLRHSIGPTSHRVWLAVNDVVLVSAPFAFAFAVWAAMAKVIVGEWFPTFTSTYGNTSQVATGRATIESVTGTTSTETLTYLSAQILGLSPFLLPLLIMALAASAWRRQSAMLAGPLVLGAVLVFNSVVLLSGSSFGWLRFQIAVIPLSVLLAGSVIAAVANRGVRPVGRLAVVFLSAGMLAAAIPVEARTLTTVSGGLAREESQKMRATFLPHLASQWDRSALQQFKTEQQVADYLDRLDLDDGTVLTDTSYAFAVVLASARPTQFVITSDLDFEEAVADPAEHGIEYMLSPGPAEAPNEALRQHYPGLYQNGANIAVPIKTWSDAWTDGSWRLLRVG